MEGTRLQRQTAHAGHRRDSAQSTPRLTRGPVQLLVRELQQTAGNQAVQRLTQRYTVPASLDCGELVDWLNSNSPYAPEWAETRCNYAFQGQARVSSKTLPDGSIELRARGHNGLRVTVDCPIDRPNWAPSRRANRAAEVRAWQAMRATLDAHESQHRGIGQTWRGTLETRWRALDITATGTDAADARANLVATLEATQQQWMADAQAAQDAIDPFRGAVLTCP
jgi:hypothetical protein